MINTEKEQAMTNISKEELKKKIEERKLSREQVMKYAKAMSNLPLDGLVSRSQKSSLYSKYTKEEVSNWLSNPSSYEKELRDIVDYLCAISPQFCRLIEYIPNMALITPFIKQKDKKYKNTKVADKKLKDYDKMCEYYDTLNIKSLGTIILKEVFKYGVYYGLEIEGKYQTYTKKLDPNYCKIISEGEQGLGIAFDFSYFNGNAYLLENGYPPIFTQLYNDYQSGEQTLKGLNLSSNWQPVPVDITFVVKYDMNKNYSIPPYVNIFSALYDLDEYQSLNKAKVTAENFTMIGLKIPTLPNANAPDMYAVGNDMIDATTEQLDYSLPDYMGYFTTPADITTIKATSTSDNSVDNVANAVKNVWNSSGYSENMFGVANSTAGTLEYSTKVDEQQLFPIYRQLENHWDYKFKTKLKDCFSFKLLNTSWFNISNMIDKHLLQAQHGVPVAFILPLLLGYEITDIEDMYKMQTDIFNIYETWIPLQSSYTTSSSDNSSETSDVTGKGRPTKDSSDLTANGEKTRNYK